MAEFTPGLVTVFGGSGFVGSQVVRALAQQGWRIRVAVRRPGRAHALMTQGHVGQIQSVRCDITDPAAVAGALRGADAVVNLVGILAEGPSRKFKALHVEGSRIIAEASVVAGVTRLVQMSALGADAASKAEYGRTKAEAEVAVRAVRPDAVIIRPSVIFGPGDNFLNKFATLSGFAPALPLIGGGQTKFQPVYVGDVAEAIARAVARVDAAGRTFELGGPSVWTFEDILKLIGRETNRPRALLPIPFPVARLMGAVAQLTAFVGIPPQLTRDQVLMLQSDNVVSPGAEGLSALGIQPTGLEAIAPSYLWRYRKGGQFADRPAT